MADLVFMFMMITYVLMWCYFVVAEPGLLWNPAFWVPMAVYLLVCLWTVYENGKAIWLAVRYGPVTACILFIGQALLDTLVETRVIRTHPSKLRVKAEKMEFGQVYCALTGATYYETQVFLDSFQEILNPIENPRYLMVRKTITGRKVKKDFHAVPDVIGLNKNRAKVFQKHWRRAVGPCELVFTRSIEGRKMLLQARQDSLSGHLAWRSDRTSQWK
jgi:hypothetical protein